MGAALRGAFLAECWKGEGGVETDNGFNCATATCLREPGDAASPHPSFAQLRATT